MSLSRIVLVLFAASPLTFGASKEIMELQRDVAMLQDQVRTMQKEFGDRLVATQTLVQSMVESVNRTNSMVDRMGDRFNDAIKQQQQGLSGSVSGVNQKLDQMSEDFRAVRESVLDMNARMGKLDAKMADLQNLVNTLRTPAPPPPGATTNDTSGTQTQTPTGPPAGVSAETLYSNAVRDLNGGKRDLAMQEFNDYLRYFPTTQFAANAQFYLGDIAYRKADYPTALQAFDSVLERYPDGNKTADAHYMKGLTLLQLAKNDAAAVEFREVVRRYPDEDIAAQAKARLKEMGLSVGAATPARRRTR